VILLGLTFALGLGAAMNGPASQAVVSELVRPAGLQEAVAPGYEQRAFPLDAHQDKWILVASKDGRDGSITMHQDVDVWAAGFLPGEQSSFPLKPSRIS
jgi:Quercetinase C-terminal cupin domain